MAAKLRKFAGGYLFWCPGCKAAHGVKVGPGAWMFNGDEERPAFFPSILVRSGHFAEGHPRGGECWCTLNRQHPAEAEQGGRFSCRQCHAIVGGAVGGQPGFIQYLPDCTHELAGQTVELPDYPLRSAFE